MFERYTAKARGAINLARQEASDLGSPRIETEHLLLGLLREDKVLAYRYLGSSSAAIVHKQIEESTPAKQRILPPVDFALSQNCERVLAYAAEEAERLNHKYVGNEHLLLGILHDERVAANLRRWFGLTVESVRRHIAPKSS